MRIVYVQLQTAEDSDGDRSTRPDFETISPTFTSIMWISWKKNKFNASTKKKGGGGEAVKIWQPYKPLEDGIAVQVFS